MKKINWQKIAYEAMRRTVGTPESRKQRKAEREVLERIHGLIQSNSEPPEEGEHHNFYQDYIVVVKWSGPEGHHLIEALVYVDKKGYDYHYLGSCEFTYVESSDGKKYFRSRSKGIIQPM